MNPLKNSSAVAKLTALWSTPSLLHPLIGTEGYRLPLLGDVVWHPLDGLNNWVVAHPKQEWNHQGRSFKIQSDASNNIIVFGEFARASGTFSIKGHDSTFIVLAGLSDNRISLHSVADQCLFFWGQRSTSVSTAIFLQGINKSVIVGEDCMFSHGVVLRNNDDHAIIDLESGEWLNMPETVIVEPCVWLGPEAVILKGCTIGYGSIVAQRSAVSRSVDRFSLVGGVPSRIIRTGVTWNREMQPNPHTVRRAKERASLIRNPAR